MEHDREAIAFRVRAMRARALHGAIRLRNRGREVWWTAWGAVAGRTDGLELVRWSTDRPRPRRLRRADPDLPELVGRYDGRVVIEPTYGYALTRRGVVLEVSVANADYARRPGWRHLWSLPPVVASLRAVRRARRGPADHGCVVSVAAAWPDNYFHFYNDVLPQLVLLDAAGIDPGLPVVVPARLAAQPFFRDACTRGSLARRRFVVLDRPVTADSLVVAAGRYAIGDGSKYLAAAQLLDLAPATVQRTTGAASRSIFLDRSEQRGRRLLNTDVILDIARRADFEIVDADDLDLAGQARLFASARRVVGIHGAGLTNILFAAGHDLDVVELCPPGVSGATDFAAMCAAFGFGHRAVIGVDGGRRLHWGESFAVDPEEFTRALEWDGR